MNKSFTSTPDINVVYRLIKYGLCHAKRNCNFCNSAMVLCRASCSPHGGPAYQSKNYKCELEWKCNLCWMRIPATKSTPMCGMNLRSFDIALKTWIFGYQK